MKAAKSDRKQQAIRAVLAQGPQRTDDLIAALADRGIRIDSTDLFLLCREYGVATLDPSTGQWTPQGMVPEPAEPRPERREADRIKNHQRPHGLRIDRHSELQEMRSSLIDDTDPEPQPVHPLHPGWHDTATAASAALRDELREVTRTRIHQDVPLVAGELVEQSPSRMIVRYEIQSGDAVREGLVASLIPAESDGRAADAVEAEVLTQFAAEITLKLPAGTAFWAKARLRCDLSWLVSRQITTVDGFRAGTTPGFCSEAALAVVTSAGLLDNLSAPAGIPVPGLNDQQRLAVAHGLQDRLTWLWGPPGTGKTTTLAGLLAELLDSGKAVLLAAPTNAAVDVALEALLRRRLPALPGEIARIGITDNPDLLGRPVPVLVDEIAAAQGALPAQRLVETRAELADLRARAESATAAKSPDRIALIRKIADLREFIQELEKLVGEVRAQVIRKARLIACTTHQILLKELYARSFDTVVLDEASMVSAAMAMLVAGAGKGHTVVAGDFRQLPPIVQADSPGTREWLGRSPFEKSGVAAAVRRGHLPSNLVALRQQHRMRRQIGDAVGSAFYPEIDLVTAASVDRRPARTVEDRQPQLVVVDTTGLAAVVARRGGMGSRYNLAHAQLAANAVHTPLTTAQHAGAVGLISPFSPQAGLLQSLRVGKTTAVTASTVHRFQGGETDIVLYDTVDTTGSKFQPHSWFTVTQMGSEGARLLNVAMSRAREQAILLADMSYLRRHCPAGTPVRKFLDHLSGVATVRSWRVTAEGSGPTTLEQNLVPVLDDISRATESIDIFTAATNGSLTCELVEILTRLPDSVKVSLWYRSDAPTSAGRVEHPLRHHHTMLHPLNPVHESCIIADGIVWSATRPILGTDPGTLLRTEHPALAAAVRRQLLRRTLNDAPGTGEHGLRCGCGRIRVRTEVRGGPRQGVRSVCRACRD